MRKRFHGCAYGVSYPSRENDRGGRDKDRFLIWVDSGSWTGMTMDGRGGNDNELHYPNRSTPSRFMS
ncbi:hypothetical protein IIB79_12745 [candidate division KSB1 bacterium]|nr:hypothetical protein [candidate division KSB1 bacterium]